MAIEFKKRIKDLKPFVYIRVSTLDQKKTLETQKQGVLAQLKKLGIKKTPKIYMEQASGSDPNREKWLEMQEDILAQKDPSKSGAFMRDFNRWSRQAFNGPARAELMRNANVPIIALVEQAYTGTKAIPNPTGDLLFGIQMGFGSFDREVGRERTGVGVEESRKKGIISGTIKNLYPENEQFSFRKAWELIQAKKRGEETWSTVNIKLGRERLKPTPAQRKRGRTEGDFSNYVSKKLREFLEEVESKLGADGLQKYFKVVDKVVDMERKHGTGRNNPTNKKMWGVRRASSLYLGVPWEYVEKTGEHMDPTEIDFFYENYKDFLPKR